MNVAAPASQPVPPTDATIPAGGSKDAAAAFDAALAATLGPVDGQAAPAASAGAKVAQPAWLFAQFLAPTATACDSATPPATIVDETVEADPEAVLADVDADDESSDELDAIAANLVVPVPMIAEIKNPIVPQGGPVADGGTGVTGEQAMPAPMMPSTPAGLNGAAQARVPAGAVLGGRPGAPAEAPGQPANAPVVGAAVDMPAADATAASIPVDQPASADSLAGISDDRREMPVSAKAQLPRPELAQVAQPSEAASNVAASAPALAGAIAAVADQAAPAANATATPARTETAESGAAVRQAMSWQAHTGHDAPMTGQDHFGQGQSQGQGRPSPEFARFAAALAQVTSAAEDGGRATGPVVAPAASPAAPAAAPVQVTAAAAAAAPQTTAQTPEAESLGRLVQAMRVISRPGAWEANVRLKPEHLGDVNIAVRVERNTVSAVVNAEAAGVRQWLESQEQAVRSGMAEHGLHLERFVVQRDGQRREPQHQDPQESPRHRARRPAASTERFEIVV